MSAIDHTPAPPEMTVILEATAVLRAIGALLDEAGIPDGDLLARVRALRNPLAGIGSRLLFSQRAALDRAGAPTAGEDGCPVSDGWRAKWAAEEVVRLRTRLEEEGRLVVRLMDEADKAADQTIRRNERDALRAEVERLSRLSGVLAEVATERERQVAKGYDAAHDDQHTDGELATAAGLIALGDYDLITDDGPGDVLAAVVLDKHADIRERRLIIAAALLVAEVERLDRASTPAAPA